MKSYKVKGGGGVKLHVEETGNPYGTPILFIHGFSQCGLCWNKQFHSSLGDAHRLVRMDIRGHGQSGKPKNAYGDSKLWGDDVAAVIDKLELDKPILSGWSYGGVIICDYLKTHGTKKVGGVHMVAAVSMLGEDVIPYLGEEFVGLVPGFFSTDAAESAAALSRFMQIAVAAEASPEDHYFMLGYNTIVPPHVRQGLFSRALNNDAMLKKLKIPALLSYGSHDEIVLLSMGEHHKKLMPNATFSVHHGVGHAVFFEDAERFNRELAAFALSTRA